MHSPCSAVPRRLWGGGGHPKGAPAPWVCGAGCLLPTLTPRCENWKGMARGGARPGGSGPPPATPAGPGQARGPHHHCQCASSKPYGWLGPGRRGHGGEEPAAPLMGRTARRCARTHARTPHPLRSSLSAALRPACRCAAAFLGWGSTRWPGASGGWLHPHPTPPPASASGPSSCSVLCRAAAAENTPSRVRPPPGRGGGGVQPRLPQQDLHHLLQNAFACLCR